MEDTSSTPQLHVEPVKHLLLNVLTGRDAEFLTKSNVGSGATDSCHVSISEPKHSAALRRLLVESMEAWGASTV